MKWILLGVLLGLLIVYPSFLGLVVTIAAAIVSKPVVVAFGLGLVARPHLQRRWTR